MPPIIDKIVFRPRKEKYPGTVSFNGISGIWIRKGSNGVILHFHGNAVIASEVAYDDDVMRCAKKYDLGIFAVDPSGYGSSEGSPSIYNIKIDAEKAADYIKSQNQPKIIVWGMSMGGAYALHAANRLGTRCSELVLQSTFGDLFDCGGILGIIARYTITGYSNIGVLEGKTSFPIMIYHSREDEVVPFSSAEKLARSLEKSSKVTFYEIGGKHSSPIFVTHSVI